MTFRLAPMSPFIRWLTVALWVLPVYLLAAALVFGPRLLLGAAVFVVLIYVATWFWFRPSLFVVTPEGLEVVWPLRRRVLPRRTITGARLITARELREEIGLGMRIGVGGLWGAFGLLWTTRRGLVQMYVSRTDALVWIERGRERPWLLTPERPEELVKALAP
jgi:hypothetical protein